MRIAHVPLILFCLACSIALYSQNSTQYKSSKTEDATQEFTYKGKPISPEMIIPFFPDPEDNSSQTVVNLDNGLMYQVNIDTAWTSGIKWLKPSQAKRAYACMGDEGLVSYIVLHNIAPNRFVILACTDMNEPFIEFYTFVVDIKANKLVKAGQMKTDNIKEYSVDLKNNSLIYHDSSYLLPQ